MTSFSRPPLGCTSSTEIWCLHRYGTVEMSVYTGSTAACLVCVVCTNKTREKSPLKVFMKGLRRLLYSHAFLFFSLGGSQARSPRVGFQEVCRTHPTMVLQGYKPSCANLLSSPMNLQVLILSCLTACDILPLRILTTSRPSTHTLGFLRVPCFEKNTRCFLQTGGH